MMTGRKDDIQELVAEWKFVVGGILCTDKVMIINVMKQGSGPIGVKYKRTHSSFLKRLKKSKASLSLIQGLRGFI